MDRHLARKNLRTGFVVAAILVAMFALTFLAAYIYTS